MRLRRIALVGDYNAEVTAHRAIPRALELAAAVVGTPVEGVWVGTAKLGPDALGQIAEFDAVWCIPASPYANIDGALAAIQFARESGRPFLGTCGGFQHALLEYARNILGLGDAAHSETSPDAALPFIAPLSCSLVEKTGSILLAHGSRLRDIYGAAVAEEMYHCNYGLNPHYEKALEGQMLHVCGRDQDGAVRAVELENHPFFIATLYQPERVALQGKAHPLVNAFVAAIRVSPSSPAISAPSR
jgi:CTP synthase (UTP-ammonia lyase)